MTLQSPIMERASEIYPTSQIKRVRATKSEVAARRGALFDIVGEMQPMTVRQVFYRATVRGLVEKTESGYGRVQSDLAEMRRHGDLPYEWLTDSTRLQRKPVTYDNVVAAIDDTARTYRKALWSDVHAHVEVWLEKDALSGVVYPVTSSYDVPLMVARGYSSLSFLHSAATYIASLKVPAFIYHLGDYDPSGVNAGEKIEQTLRDLAPNADIRFERIGVTTEQIPRWRLSTRPTKSTDSRARNFGDVSVELDAIEPQQLRDLVRETIERHISPPQLEALRAAEASERRLLKRLAGMLTEGGEA